MFPVESVRQVKIAFFLRVLFPGKRKQPCFDFFANSFAANCNHAYLSEKLFPLVYEMLPTLLFNRKLQLKEPGRKRIVLFPQKVQHFFSALAILEITAIF